MIRSEINLFDVVGRKHPILSRPVHCSRHPTLVHVNAVDDDVAVVERHLVCVLSLVVVDGPEATIFPALRPRLKKETSLIN